jgi:replicative DNA helicase
MTAAAPSVIESTVPRNVEAERALLGSLLRSNDFYETVTDTALLVTHFYDQDNAEAFRVITEMLDAQRSATPITLANHIDKTLLSSLCDARISPSRREVREWAVDIMELAARRELQKVGKRLSEMAVTVEWNKSTAEILADAEADLYRLEPESGTGDGPVRFNTPLSTSTF